MTNQQDKHQGKWTLDELDLGQQLVTLESLIPHKQLLVEKLFNILSKNEILNMIPENLKDFPLDILKDIIIIELKDNQIVTDDEMMKMIGSTAQPKIEDVVPEVHLAEKAVTIDEKEVGEEQDSLSEELDKEMKKNFAAKFNNLREEDLDLREQFVKLEDMIKDPVKLVESLFVILTRDEIEEVKPRNLAGMDEETLKKLCVDVVHSLPLNVILSSLAGKDLPGVHSHVCHTQVKKEPSKRKKTEATGDDDDENYDEEEGDNNEGGEGPSTPPDIIQEEKLREIEELEAKARALRSLLAALEKDHSNSSSRDSTPLVEDVGPSTSTISRQMTQDDFFSTRIRDDEEDSLDRELKGQDEEGDSK